MLELKHILPYLEYGLYLQADKWSEKVIGYEIMPKDETRVKLRIGGNEKGSKVTYWTPELKHCKPILHPLSALTKEITLNGDTFIPMEMLWSTGWDEYIDNNGHKILKCDLSELPYYVVLNLCLWKFDVNDLIGKGLAIAVTKENNPY
jgi:hypothetical protein